MRIISALRTMMAQEASDVHITVGTPPGYPRARQIIHSAR